MHWLDFIALILAASAVTDVWLNGSIFSTLLALLQDKADSSILEPEDATAAADELREGEAVPISGFVRLVDTVVPPKIAELLTCWFCLSHHTPWILSMLFLFPALFVTTPAGVFLLKLPVYSLAATRVSFLIDAWLPPHARYIR
jgi:hypothetical protein